MDYYSYSYHQSLSPVKSQPDTETDQQELILAINQTNETQHLNQLRCKVKTSLCKNFTLTGFCPYFNKCQFAHGPQQLRCNQIVNTSYKTKPCFTFLKKGICGFGDRCNYIHEQKKSIRKNRRALLLSNFPQLILDLHETKTSLLTKLI